MGGPNPLKTVLSGMTDREKTLCFGTPRVVHPKKEGFMGMT
jgi:hypothetical protein